LVLETLELLAAPELLPLQISFEVPDKKKVEMRRK